MRATKHSDAQRTFSISFRDLQKVRSLAEVERYDFLMDPKKKRVNNGPNKTHKKNFYKNMEP